MAAEPETHRQPPEPPITTEPSPAIETAAEPTRTAHPTAENAGPPPKRQRRPSVRLGEIGDRRAAATSHNSHTRRSNIPPWSWRTPKEASRTAKARSLTNLANGGEESNGISEFTNRRGKSKRRGSSTTKRLRSNHAPTERDDYGDEGFRDFDHDHSPVHSVEENGIDYWRIGNQSDHDHCRDDRARVSEEGVESESREWRRNSCEGVRSWLFELGLSRYAPMFEIHEVDDELLPMLTLEDLKDMGINAVGSRRKMYTAIQKLKKGFP